MSEISYPIQSVAFGHELAWLFLPGEVVVDYSLRLKRQLDGSRLWIHAYANACPGYVPSERILREGGYEGGNAMIYYDIPGPYAAGLEQQIVDHVMTQLKDRIPPAAAVEHERRGDSPNLLLIHPIESRRNAFDRQYTKQRTTGKHSSFDIHHSLFIIRYSIFASALESDLSGHGWSSLAPVSDQLAR